MPTTSIGKAHPGLHISGATAAFIMLSDRSGRRHQNTEVQKRRKSAGEFYRPNTDLVRVVYQDRLQKRGLAVGRFKTQGLVRN
jgi:hypothetical protein